jgi:predicted RNase H-like HicB family nuclease
VPGLPGAHTQAETPDELQGKLREVMEMLHEEGDLTLETGFVGTEMVIVA